MKQPRSLDEVDQSVTPVQRSVLGAHLACVWLIMAMQCLHCRIGKAWCHAMCAVRVNHDNIRGINRGLEQATTNMVRSLWELSEQA